ncbi:hypothetical protein BKH42_05405 [Helicobacter sp. 13S00482-2]|uniref:hypothetical protein n=1 Tax=Helicobacter sp. 13S00482-2 TaxID=1476200 RepID=UPI000BA61C78|nr:hypothetical protein [Helicobacter sp. 13S00482-2]PAF53488.1 hypothetical protein BKH42_05405 [Helicobacter sp. 13S00482-2]
MKKDILSNTITNNDAIKLRFSLKEHFIEKGYNQNQHSIFGSEIDNYSNLGYEPLFIFLIIEKGKTLYIDLKKLG